MELYQLCIWCVHTCTYTYMHIHVYISSCLLTTEVCYSGLKQQILFFPNFLHHVWFLTVRIGRIIYCINVTVDQIKHKVYIGTCVHVLCGIIPFGVGLT